MALVKPSNESHLILGIPTEDTRRLTLRGDIPWEDHTDMKFAQ